VLISFGWEAYGTALWFQRAAEYLLLSYLAADICSKFVGEKNRIKTSRYAAMIALMLSGVLTFIFRSGETLTDKLLDTTIMANMMLAVVIAVGWLSRDDKLPRKWRGITAALLIYLGSEAVVTVVWKEHQWAAQLFPIGHVAALVTWCWTVGPKKSKQFGSKREQVQRLERMWQR
jgi:hypothetical protein